MVSIHLQPHHLLLPVYWNNLRPSRYFPLQHHGLTYTRGKPERLFGYDDRQALSLPAYRPQYGSKRISSG
ncbi:hypothetical protein KCP75_08595 [Salmonella enterica subsp. enterica]|nr:hypothetical protein KCP75_08595 [Salmonella enterica subsp. enterica]